MINIWDKEPTNKIREMSIKNMTNLGIVLADMCYTALKAFEDKKGDSLNLGEMEQVVDLELYLLVEQNIKNQEWRDLIFKMAREQYYKSKSSTIS
jgi:hypothetical protein